MRFTFQIKLFLALFGLAVAPLLGAGFYMASALESQLGVRIRDDSLVRLALAERAVSSEAQPLEDAPAYEALAQDLGRRARARVTIVRANGRVIGDSEVALPALASLESHANRPEVKDALARGHGRSERVSATVHERLAYYAVPFHHGGQLGGVVRIAVSLAEIDAAVSSLRSIVLASSLFASLAAALLSGFVAHSMSRAVCEVTRTARRMAAGDLGARAPPGGSDELADLGRALDSLATSLSDAMVDLRRERDLLIAIFDEMEEGVLVLGAGRVVRVNAALRSMLLLGSQVLGQPLLEVVRDAELHRVAASPAAEPTTGEVDILGMKPRRLLVRSAPIGGSPETRVVVVRDVTDVRRLEAMRRDFVANVSHELRTPVTSVRSAAETARDSLARDPGSTARFLEIIERNAERMQRLVEDLLDLSRIESRELRLRLESLDVAPVVTHVAALYAERAEAQGVLLRTSIEQGLLVCADRRALEQVLGNLVENAVKYAPRACVDLRAVRSEEGGVMLVVRDTGPGIAEADLPRIFERFYRVDAGRSRDLGGTGLGLSIVKHLAEAMGGRVAVDSRVGEGTTFTVLLDAPARSA